MDSKKSPPKKKATTPPAKASGPTVHSGGSGFTTPPAKPPPGRPVMPPSTWETNYKSTGDYHPNFTQAQHDWNVKWQASKPSWDAPYDKRVAWWQARKAAKPADGQPRGGSSAPSAPPAAPGGMTGTQQGAFDYMTQQLANFGLPSLGGVLKGLILDGTTDPAQLTLALQSTPEWKTRFAGNEALKANGLGVLPVDQYLAVEHSYGQVLKNYGLPQGFYDDPSDFAKWIGASVSPNELNQRAMMYADLANRDDPAIKAQLAGMGMTQGSLMAYLMDPGRAAPLLQKEYSTALVGGAARRAGVTANDAGHLVDIGVTEQQAIQGFGQIADELPTYEQLGHVYGDKIGEADLEKSLFDGDTESTRKKKRLASQERAAFSGNSSQVAQIKSAGSF